MKARSLLPVLLSLGLIGCASVGSSNTRRLLSASGFTVKTPETEKQKEVYAAAESYRVMRISRDGMTFYAYKDEQSGTAYIGDEKAYQEYERLSIQQNIASQQYQAAEMNRQMALGWYGAYSPYAYGAGYGRIGRYYR